MAVGPLRKEGGLLNPFSTLPMWSHIFRATQEGMIFTPRSPSPIGSAANSNVVQLQILFDCIALILMEPSFGCTSQNERISLAAFDKKCVLEMGTLLDSPLPIQISVVSQFFN